jgi:hypothetical protein
MAIIAAKAARQRRLSWPWRGSGWSGNGELVRSLVGRRLGSLTGSGQSASTSAVAERVRRSLSGARASHRIRHRATVRPAGGVAPGAGLCLEAARQQRLARHDLEGHGREAVHVVARIRRRAGDSIRTGEGGRQSAVAGPRGARAQAHEVDELRVAIQEAESAPRDQHIGGLDVAVDKAGLVLRAQSGGDLAHPPREMHGQGRHARLRLEQGLQRLAIDPLATWYHQSSSQPCSISVTRPGWAEIFTSFARASASKAGASCCGTSFTATIGRSTRSSPVVSSTALHTELIRPECTSSMSRKRLPTRAGAGGCGGDWICRQGVAWPRISRLEEFRFPGRQAESGAQWLCDKGACGPGGGFLGGVFVELPDAGLLQADRGRHRPPGTAAPASAAASTS